MTKILIGLALSLSMMATTLPIYAKENKDSIYENELNEAILSGSGTENDPYIVDYEKAPNFHEYVINVYEEARGKSNLRASGFTGYVLTTYKAVYNNGAAWFYNSGGLSVNVDGNLRVQKATYISNQEVNRIVAVMNVPNKWTTLKNIISNLPGLGQVAIINKIAKEFTSVGGYSASSIGHAVATAIAAIGTYGASWDLVSYMIDNGLNSGLYSAVNNGTSCVNVVYLSSYHGAWY